MARLIDADIALENIDEWLDTVGTALIGRGLSYYAELQGCIEDAPTVDAVPLSELIELRDRLITRGGLRELNMLIDKYEGGRKDGNNGTA